MKKQELIEYLKEDEIPEETLNDILNAKNWETEKKENFINFIHEALQWLSYQNDKENIIRVKKQYELYLICINE